MNRDGGSASPPLTQEDGQSAEASVEACSGDACDDAQARVCGNGIIEQGEQCDDGNAIPGDGCSGVCQIEPGYTCPTPGRRCGSTGSEPRGTGKVARAGPGAHGTTK